VIGQLAANFPGSTWDSIPKGSFNFGGGGVNSWGSICGGANAGGALLAQLGAPTQIKDEFFRWYETTAIPSNAAYLDSTTGGGSWAAFVAPLNNAPKSKAESLLCHASLTRWTEAAGGNTGYWFAEGGNASDRCAKLVYDCVFELATLINNWKAGQPYTSLGVLDVSATAAGCMNPSCHADGASAALRSRGKTTCTTGCHE
jgi:hypothetical protein